MSDKRIKTDCERESEGKKGTLRARWYGIVLKIRSNELTVNINK